MTEQETNEWFESEFAKIRAGRVPLISLRNVRYRYAEPEGGSIEMAAISSRVEANTSK